MVEEQKDDLGFFRYFNDFSEVYSWKKTDKIGKGGFGKVYRAKMKTNDTTIEVAVKKYESKIDDEESKSDNIKSMCKEVRMLKNFPHPLVIKYIDSFRD